VRRFVGIVLLIAAAAGFAAAVQARIADLGGTDSPEPGSGVTGQREWIAFRFDRAGHPRALTTRLWALCPGGDEHRTDWAAADGALVRFRLDGDRLRIEEGKPFDYANGAHGVEFVRLEGRVDGRRVEGTIRAHWSFVGYRRAIDCDSGNVPFATGRGAEDRLAGVGPVRQPWTLYPAAPGKRLGLSSRRLAFARRVDDVCTQTYWELRNAIRNAWRGPGGQWRFLAAYVPAHAAQLTALHALGDPPSGEDAYRRWLDSLEQRVALERRVLTLVRRWDLPAAAAVEARIATLTARSNVYGLTFGLRACVSDGPTGAPTS
jgi:hypothetical protein